MPAASVPCGLTPSGLPVGLQIVGPRFADGRVLGAAAYNGGVGAVTRYDGVRPYPGTQGYVAEVQALYARYQAALAPRGAGTATGSATD